MIYHRITIRISGQGGTGEEPLPLHDLAGLETAYPQGESPASFIKGFDTIPHAFKGRLCLMGFQSRILTLPKHR